MQSDWRGAGFATYFSGVTNSSPKCAAGSFILLRLPLTVAQHRLLPSHRAVAQTSSLRQNQKPSSLRFDGGGPMAVTMRNRMALTRRAVMKSTVATAAWSVIGGIARPSLSFAPDRPQITHGIQS